MLDVAPYRSKPVLGTFTGYERTKGWIYDLANAYHTAYGHGINLNQVWGSGRLLDDSH